MPSGRSEEVAADHSATETPAEGDEAAGEAGSVEQTAPPTVDPVAEGSRNWADLSEVDSTALSGEAASSELVQVKEEPLELQEAQSLGAVLSTIGLPEEVADEPVATEDLVVETSLEDQSFLEPPSDLGNPAEAAFTDIDRAKEEEVDQQQQESSTLLEQTECEADTSVFADPVESADVDFTGDDTSVVAEVPQAETEGLTAEAVASEAAVASEPVVADTSGVATEANTSCPDPIVPPPTSPNLVTPGADPIQVGHSPATSSTGRRPRVRSSRGGATTRWQEAKRGWWADFEAVQWWLYNNSGGVVAGGFWLSKIAYEDATEDQRWFVALHSRLIEKLTTSQCLSLAFHIFPTYNTWTHRYGLDRRRGTAHAEQVIDSGDLPPKRKINQLILGAEHPRAEEWDRYYRYIGPQQQPLPKAERAAASTSVGGAPSGTATQPVPVPKEPKEPGHPPPGWQPSLRSLDHPAKVPAPRVTVSVHPVPKGPKSGSQGVAAFGRDVAAVPVASPARPPPKARPKAPDSAATTLADRIQSLPPPPNTIAPSPPVHKQPPLPPPSTPPPGDLSSLPPPPSHPPPTAQELAARESRQAEAPETAPADPNDPPPEEGEWVVEEEEEEEFLEEDAIVEVEEEAEPEFPDFVTTERSREVSTRQRRPKRNRSDPPVPVNLVPRETRERIELNQEIYRARQITGVSRRPLALRPQVHGYPEIRIDAAGTWARVADPPIANAPQTLPYLVPHGENRYPELAVNPHELPDSTWRDPSLRAHQTILGSSNLDPNSVYNIAVDNPSTESEGSETAETRTARFVSSAEAFVGQQEPVDAGFAERLPSRPSQQPLTKRQRANARTSQVPRDKTNQPRKESSPAQSPPPTVPSLAVPSLSSSSQSAFASAPWRQPQLTGAAAGVVDTTRVATETTSEPAASPIARSRSRAPSAETAPAVAAASASRGRGATVSNKISSSKLRKRASSVPVPKRAKGAAVPDTPQRPEPLPPAPEAKKNLPWKQPPVTIPPRPNRPAPPNPAKLKPVKPPPPGVSVPKPASTAASQDLPPLGPEEQQQQRPEQEPSSGSGLAPHQRGKPLPPPTPDRPEGVAGPVPRHYQHQPKLVSRVVHVNTQNIIVCIDWHDTLDQALNPIGELSSHLVEKFRALTRIAGNRIEFHVVSYAGASKVESTKASAEHVIGQLIYQGLPFRELHLARHPCGREGKASICTALQAHCLVDDRSDILNENRQLGIKTIRSEGKNDRELTWIAEVEDWVRHEGLDFILHSRRAVPLRPNQWYPKHGGKDDPSLW